MSLARSASARAAQPPSVPAMRSMCAWLSSASSSCHGSWRTRRRESQRMVGVVSGAQQVVGGAVVGADPGTRRERGGVRRHELARGSDVDRLVGRSPAFIEAPGAAALLGEDDERLGELEDHVTVAERRLGPVQAWLCVARRDLRRGRSARAPAPNARRSRSSPRPSSSSMPASASRRATAVRPVSHSRCPHHCPVDMHHVPPVRAVLDLVGGDEVLLGERRLSAEAKSQREVRAGVVSCTVRDGGLRTLKRFAGRVATWIHLSHPREAFRLVSERHGQIRVIAGIALVLDGGT